MTIGQDRATTWKPRKELDILLRVVASSRISQRMYQRHARKLRCSKHFVFALFVGIGRSKLVRPLARRMQSQGCAELKNARPVTNGVPVETKWGQTLSEHRK